MIESIADNEAYLAFNMTPVSHILTILKDSFDPKAPVDPFSLHLTARPKKIMSAFRYDFFLILCLVLLSYCVVDIDFTSECTSEINASIVV